MKTTLALLSLFVSVLSSEAALSPECSWGPSYWCQSKTTASQCGQEAYCNNQVWKVEPPKVESNVGTVQCDVCKILVKYAQQYVENNATESDAENAIKDICSKLGSLKDECDQVVDAFFPEIWQMLVSEVDPDKVCSEIQLCSNTLKARAKEESIVGSVQCDVCKLVIGLVQKEIDKNSTEAEAKAAIEEACSILASLKDECDTLVDTFFPQIWQLLVDEVDPSTICSEIKLCSSAQPAKVQSLVLKGVQCDVCKIVLSYLQKFAEKNATADVVQQELDKLCSVLGSLSDECRTLMTFFPQLWDAIINELDPSTVCSQVGLCTAKSVKQPQFAQLSAVSKVNADGCTICKTVVEAIESLILSNTTEELAEKEVKRVCFFLGPLYSECKDMIDTYFPKMWQLLQEKLSADEVCSELKLCQSSASLKAVPKVVQSAECDVCKIISLYLSKFLGSNGTESEAKDEVEKLCGLLGSMSSECRSIVDVYFDEIWQLIETQIEPSVICEMLKLCPSSAVKATNLKISLPKQSLCDLCELAVSFLQPYVDSNTTESEVKSALEQLCGLLPSDYKSQCTDFVDKNFDGIWALVKSEVDNDLICKQIGVCNSTLRMLKFPVSKPKSSLPKQAACDVCKLVVTFLQRFVNGSTAESDVKKALEELCTLLPSGFKDECNTLVDQNFDMIWRLVQSEFDNSLICQQIGLCSSSGFTLTKKQLDTVAAVQANLKKLALPKQTLCDLCKLVVPFLQPYVDSNSTEKEVEDALDKFCSLLPGDYSGQCNTLLDTFFPAIWDMLKNEVDSGQVCSMLGLCTSSSTITKSLAASKPRVRSGPLCTICKLVSSFIRSFVENQKTKAEAEKAIDEVCTNLPSPYNSTCTSLVDTYFDMIWNLIDSYVDDDDLCKQLNLCNETAMKELKTAATSSPLCILCEYVMKELESMLDTNSTEAEIQAALDKVCGLLPSTIKSDCDEFVDTYGKDIIQLLLKAVSARVVCTALQLCAVSRQERVLVMPVVESAGLKDDCAICKVVLGFVKTLVEDYQKPVEDALEDVCILMPSAIKDECSVFVEEFAPAIIQLVDKEINPETICKHLKVCSEQLKKKEESALMAPWKKLARAKTF